jgi:hypothetical protein
LSIVSPFFPWKSRHFRSPKGGPPGWSRLGWIGPARCAPCDRSMGIWTAPCWGPLRRRHGGLSHQNDIPRKIIQLVNGKIIYNVNHGKWMKMAHL